ncbi:Uncharacterized protein TCM_037172 [Theobroma cacao]|uniref:Uncharacterized protein n=1 Tax=Theobroma cacao TaxID=3641 RepID=A0A061GKQ9_THECC|nr:Uncharacterized protein TCM_037172 [Theobroma cacao]
MPRASLKIARGTCRELHLKSFYFKARARHNTSQSHSTSPSKIIKKKIRKTCRSVLLAFMQNKRQGSKSNKRQKKDMQLLPTFYAFTNLFLYSSISPS